MDYRGQKLSENIYYFLTILFGGVAWIAGYIQGDFTITVYGWFIGLAISLVLCIPDWPMYNRDQVTWLEEIGQSNRSSATPVAAVDSKPKHAKKN